MAERSNAAVLKTVEVKASGGSNPSPSAKNKGRSAPFIFGVSKVRTTAAEENRDCGIVLSAVGSRFAVACGCEAIEPLKKEGDDDNFMRRRSSLSFRQRERGAGYCLLPVPAERIKRRIRGWRREWERAVCARGVREQERRAQTEQPGGLFTGARRQRRESLSFRQK